MGCLRPPPFQPCQTPAPSLTHLCHFRYAAGCGRAPIPRSTGLFISPPPHAGTPDESRKSDAMQSQIATRPDEMHCKYAVQLQLNSTRAAMQEPRAMPPTRRHASRVTLCTHNDNQIPHRNLCPFLLLPSPTPSSRPGSFSLDGSFLPPRKRPSRSVTAPPISWATPL
jgi:hypothetical protein